MIVLLRFWTHLRFRIELHTRLAADIVFALGGIGLALLGGTTTLEIVGGVCTAITTGLFVRDMRELWRRQQETEVAENEDYNELILTCRRPAGYDLEYGGLALAENVGIMKLSQSRPYITNPGVNAALDTAQNALVVPGDHYAVPDRLQDHRARCVRLKRPDFNAPKVGLRTDLTTDLLLGERTVRVQRTDYFSSAATNEMACERFNRKTGAAHRPEPLFAVSDMVVIGGMLVGLDESLLSNHIGVTTLVLTADNQIVMQAQGQQTISAGETAVGASGSVDYEDIAAATKTQATLQHLVRLAMEREAREELSATFASPGRDTTLTGYARYLARGGKPEFFGVSRSTADKCGLRPARNEQQYVSGIWGREFVSTNDGLIAAIDDLIWEGQTNRRRYSLSMVVCLRLARAHLLRTPMIVAPASA